MIPIPRTSPDFLNPKLKVIGIGGAGGNAVDRLVLDGLPGAELVALNTDLQALTASVAPSRVQIGQAITRGLGTGGDPEIGRNAAEEGSEELQRLIGDATILFILAGLGGGTGSGVLPVLADLAREQNVFVVVLGTLPFSFEGKRRTAQAAEALDAVRGLADLVICFENDKMGDIVSATASVHDAFATADRTLSQCVRAMSAMVHRRGLLRVGFDEIGNALRGEVRSYFGHGEANGDNRAHDALAAAFKSPLLDHGRALKTADAVVVQIVGGDDFTLNELTIVMDEVNRHLSENTRLFVGTATDSGMTGQISITIFCGTAGAPAHELPARELSPRQARVTRPGAPAAEASEMAAATEAYPPLYRDPEPAPAISSTASLFASEADDREEAIEAEIPRIDEPRTLHSSSAPSHETEDEEEYADDEEALDDEVEAQADYEEEAEPEPETAPAVPALRHPIFARLDAARRAEAEQASASARATKARETRQEQMQFEPVNRGRFEKSEPTIIDGQDLDVPTFMRRAPKP